MVSDYIEALSALLLPVNSVNDLKLAAVSPAGQRGKKFTLTNKRLAHETLARLAGASSSHPFASLDVTILTASRRHPLVGGTTGGAAKAWS